MVLRIGSKGSQVRSVQEMLDFLGFRVKVRPDDVDVVAFKRIDVDGVFGPETESVVLDFQQSEGLLRDGVVGTITMSALEKAFSERMLETRSPGIDFADGFPERMVFERSRADAYDQGYGQVTLRNDVAEDYRMVLEAVHAQGGILTSSGGRRSLSATVNASRSATSFHYTGLALDLFIYSGMVNPTEDPYVVEREAERTYRVHARCKTGEGVDAPEKKTIKHAISYNNRKKGQQVTGHFLDLTALFAEHGFKPIKARRRFEEGGSMMGAEWWHFQHERNLTVGFSTFGGELLKVYSRSSLETTPPWRHRDRVFGVDWN